VVLLILIDANEARFDTKKKQHKIKWVRELLKLQKQEEEKGIPKNVEPIKWIKIDLGREGGIDRVGPDVIIQGRSENMAIERKECRDFIGSVVDGHVFEQVYNGLCKIENAKAVLLIEGTWNRAFVKREYLRPMAMGAYASFVAKTKLQIVHTQSAAMTANLIRDWNRHLNDTKEYEWKPKKTYIPARKPVGLRDIAYTMIMSVPRIGQNKALSIVNKMPEPKTIANLAIQPLSRLKKIVGPKMGELMFHVFQLPLEREVKSSLGNLLQFFEEEDSAQELLVDE
jgi:ERCC4-type nuclease